MPNLFFPQPLASKFFSLLPSYKNISVIFNMATRNTHTVSRKIFSYIHLVYASNLWVFHQQLSFSSSIVCVRHLYKSVQKKSWMNIKCGRQSSFPLENGLENIWFFWFCLFQQQHILNKKKFTHLHNFPSVFCFILFIYSTVFCN